MVDTLALGASVARRVGSSPTLGTNKISKNKNFVVYLYYKTKRENKNFIYTLNNENF